MPAWIEKLLQVSKYPQHLFTRDKNSHTIQYPEVHYLSILSGG